MESRVGREVSSAAALGAGMGTIGVLVDHFLFILNADEQAASSANRLLVL